jgi:hypothetical protein
MIGSEDRSAEQTAPTRGGAGGHRAGTPGLPRFTLFSEPGPSKVLATAAVPRWNRPQRGSKCIQFYGSSQCSAEEPRDASGSTDWPNSPRKLTWSSAFCGQMPKGWANAGGKHRVAYRLTNAEFSRFIERQCRFAFHNPSLHELEALPIAVGREVSVRILQRVCHGGHLSPFAFRHSVVNGLGWPRIPDLS